MDASHAASSTGEAIKNRMYALSAKLKSSWYGRQWQHHPYRMYAAHLLGAFILALIVVAVVHACGKGPSLENVSQAVYTKDGAGMGCLLGALVLVGGPIGYFLVRKKWPAKRLEDAAPKPIPQAAAPPQKAAVAVKRPAPAAEPGVLVMSFADLGIDPSQAASVASPAKPARVEPDPVPSMSTAEFLGTPAPKSASAPKKTPAPKPDMYDHLRNNVIGFV